MNHILNINKDNVIDNINKCKGSKEVCLMVKADTYGLGNSALKMLIDLGYKFFGVSTFEEAMNIRRLNKSVKILIVSYINLDEIEKCIQNNITFTVYDFDGLKHVSKDALFHVKIDTNMGRLGFQLNEVEQLKNELIRLELKPEGVFSHLACASNNEKTKQVINVFAETVNKFKDFDCKYIHLYNTYGSLNYDTSFDNLVRVGIGIWGYFATRDEAKTSQKQLKPAIDLDVTVSHVKRYNGAISYDHLDKIDGTVLTIPLGYHDGILRKMRHFEINNIGIIVGNINMCQHMILFNDSFKVAKGDCIPYFQNEQLYDICDYCQITTYEFLVNLSGRIKRQIN